MRVPIESATYNAGNAKAEKVAADLLRLARAYAIVCLQEVADRARQLNATGAQVLQLEGKDRGHVAMLVSAPARVLSWGYEQCTRRSFVGAWGAGPRTLAAKWILWALIDPGDGSTITAASTHMVPSVERKAGGPIARIGRARRRAIYRKHVAAIVRWAATVQGPIALHMDANATKSFGLLQPLAAAGFVCQTAASHGDRPIDQIWTRDCTPEHVEALTGFSSDHRPVAATYVPKEDAPMPTPHGFMPGIIHKPIAPGSNDPAIIPVGGVLHVRDGLGPSLHDFFDGPSGGIESHFYIRFDGTIEQYRSIYFEADANLKGNSFIRDGKRCGLLSIETEGRAAGTWTEQQLASIKQIITWANDEADVPIKVIDRWDGDGWGYHIMFGTPGPWTPVRKSCPGPARIVQFKDGLSPWLAAGGNDPEPRPTLVEQSRELLAKALERATTTGRTRRAAAVQAALDTLPEK